MREDQDDSGDDDAGALAVIDVEVDDAERLVKVFEPVLV